ncbi:putative membrane protein [Acinetobacter baumannii 1295743]|uniref:Putative membrane protein n=1 Tax=Acinetobacter baumannii (strain 1295743) TaxID=1310613 RepID=A0A009I320_ACIB9|nr:putative membrane protein [Acinetobacter baumannii 1295743]
MELTQNNLQAPTWPFSFYIKIFNLNLLMIIRIIFICV